MSVLTTIKRKGKLTKSRRGKANDGMPKTRRATNRAARADDRMPRKTKGC